MTTNQKASHIREHFAPIVGEKIVQYETAELQLDDGTWDSFPDLPLRLCMGSGKLICISWSGFDDLSITDDRSLPFWTEDMVIRWVTNGIIAINAVVGASIRSVMLGRGQLAIEGNEVEIWTRLLIQIDAGWLEVFNALDENGYAFHAQRPTGVFVECA